MKTLVIAIHLLVLGFILTACGGASAATAPPTSTPAPPTTSPTVAAPTPDISVYSQMDLSDGDPQQGFNVAIAYDCKGCHDNVRPERGPRFTAVDDLPYILDRGELRITDPAYEGQTATNQDYLLESIFIPQAYTVPGEWAVTMPDDYADRIEEENLAHLLAWMGSFGDSEDSPAETSE